MLAKGIAFLVFLSVFLLSTNATDKEVSPAEVVYNQILNIGPQQCYRECKRNAICKFVGYDRVRFVCHLFDKNINATSLEQNEDFILIYNAIQMQKSIKGPCSNNTCPKGKRCEELTTSSSAVCLKTGCRHMQYSFDLNTITCYRVVVSKNLSWFDARQYCKNEGGDLISLNTYVKNWFIRRILWKYTDARYWFGLNDIEEEGQFVWSNRENSRLPVLTFWSKYQPDDLGSYYRKNAADCCVITSDGLWWDDGCEDLNPFICEITL